MPTKRDPKTGRFATTKGRDGAAKKKSPYADVLKAFSKWSAQQQAIVDELGKLSSTVRTLKAYEQMQDALADQAPAPPQQEGGEGLQEGDHCNITPEQGKEITLLAEPHKLTLWLNGFGGAEGIAMENGFIEASIRKKIALPFEVFKSRLLHTIGSKAPAPVEFKEGEWVVLTEDEDIYMKAGEVGRVVVVGEDDCFVQSVAPTCHDGRWYVKKSRLRHATPEETIKVGDWVKCAREYRSVGLLKDALYKVSAVFEKDFGIEGNDGAGWMKDRFIKASVEEIATHEREEKQRAQAAELKEVLAQIGPLKDRLLRVQHYRPATLLRDAERDIQEQLGVDQ